MKRLQTLDWLRGMMALAIVLYHLIGRENAGTVLGRLGIYGVAVFFVLSGLSMAIAYDRFIDSAGAAIRFGIRRVFRIWPLLWIAIAAVAVPAYLVGDPYSALSIVANLTTLFGFIRPSAYINGGAWSLGNEMVYYSLTPAIIALYHWRRWIGNLGLTATLIPAALFSFRFLSPASALGDQWAVYINPFNNLFLYYAGLAIYFNYRTLEVPHRWRTAAFLAPLAAFVLWPVSGNQIYLVTGANRLAFSVICIAATFAFYKCAPTLPEIVAVGLKRLGEASYGVYLLHPIVWRYLSKVCILCRLDHPALVKFMVAPVTIALSLILFKYVERPMIKLGKRITDGQQAQQQECSQELNPTSKLGRKPIDTVSPSGMTTTKDAAF
jgi:peptidoglycan/LPS O-acetylase OafA/YrhL